MDQGRQTSVREHSELDERALLFALADGQQRAFDALYRCYWPRLHRFLAQLTRRPHLVEELINDTMLAVWRNASGFRGDSRLSTWIFAIAYKKALKHLRPGEPVTVTLEDEVPGGHDPELAMQRMQQHLHLQRALATLPAEQRAAVELTYFHGYAYGEIAQIMDCPVDTVKTRMFHARRKLRLLLDAQSEEL